MGKVLPFRKPSRSFYNRRESTRKKFESDYEGLPSYHLRDRVLDLVVSLAPLIALITVVVGLAMVFGPVLS